MKKQPRPKTLAILGSTGSIGTQTLAVAHAASLPIYALAAGANAAVLAEQVRRFRPALAVMWDEAAARDLRGRLRDLPVRITVGKEGLLEAATAGAVQTVVMAVSGCVGLEPTLAALRAGKEVALANKETLVAGGDLVMDLVRGHRQTLLPVDSEHSAIWQCLNRTEAVPFGTKDVARIILTASGGPFRTWEPERLARATPEDALRHPSWTMGAKITVDSATLMNKGLEVIEAHHLFDLAYSAIDVLIHPQSIVHSMVEYRDGAILAQLGVPDMRGPIQYALSYPDRWPNQSAPLALPGKELSFEEVDRQRFPALDLAYRCGEEGGTLPTVLNAANEVCAQAFLEHRIPYSSLYSIVEDICIRYDNKPASNLDDVLLADGWAREEAARLSAQRRT